MVPRLLKEAWRPQMAEADLLLLGGEHAWRADLEPAVLSLRVFLEIDRQRKAFHEIPASDHRPVRLQQQGAAAPERRRQTLAGRPRIHRQWRIEHRDGTKQHAL